jgi:hypothetical protein
VSTFGLCVVSHERVTIHADASVIYLLLLATIL